MNISSVTAGRNIGEMLQSNMMNMGGSPIINKAMGEATNQIASAVAQEMVAAVTQTAMKYTGQTSFGQSGVAQSDLYKQRANVADQMRRSILESQLPSRSLMPIGGAYGRK